MTLVEKLMDIDAMIRDDGGINFLKIRMVLEDVEYLIQNNDPAAVPLAIQFAKELDHVHAFIRKAVQMGFEE